MWDFGDVGSVLFQDGHCTRRTDLALVFTALIILQKVLFVVLLVCGFLFVYEIPPELLNGFVPNSHEDMFGPSLGRV